MANEIELLARDGYNVLVTSPSEELNWLLFAFQVLTAASPLLIALAFLRGGHSYLFVAAGAALPLSLYLAGAPNLHYVPLLFPAMLLGAGICLRRQRALPALALVAPYICVVAVVLVRGFLLDNW